VNHPMRRIRMTIAGRVQGVGFRYYARAAALALGVKGEAMNRPDGSVHIDAEGPEEAVDQFITWCRKGPPGAIVEHVELTVAGGGGYADFTVRES
jgi:acylphosphatase